MTGEMQKAKIFEGMSELELRPWREFAVLALILMDLSWLVAWYQQLTAAGSSGLVQTYLLLGVLFLTVYWVSKGMLGLRLGRGFRRAVLGFLLIAGYFVLLRFLLHAGTTITIDELLSTIQAAFADPGRPIPVEFTFFLLTAYVWFRGSNLASRWIGVYLVRRSFQQGVLLLLLLGMVAGFVPPAPVLPAVAIFLTAGFVAMGSARASTLRLLRGSTLSGFNSVWLLSLVAFAIVIVQSAALAGGFAAAQLPAVMLFLVALLARILLVLGAVLASPVLLILAIIFPWIEERLSSAPVVVEALREVERVFDFMAGFLITISELLRDFYLRLPDLSGAKPYVLWIGLLTILAGLVWAIGKVRLARAQPVERGVEDQRTMNPGAGREWLMDLIRGGFKLFPGGSRFLNRRGYFGALRIRRIYSQLIGVCERLEVPRASTLTPLEYLEQLELLFPDAIAQVRAITHAYNRVRYGEFPESPEELMVVEKAWREVRRSARDLLAVRRTLARRAPDDA